MGQREAETEAAEDSGDETEDTEQYPENARLR